MLKSLLSLALPILMVSQAQASAFDSLNDQKMQEQALAVLEKNADTVKLTGNALPNEKLSSILKLVKDYNDEILSRLELGEDIDNLNSAISSADTTCHIRVDEKTAGCNLLITFKTIGEINVEFEVVLDSDKNVVDILGDALITRGY